MKFRSLLSSAARFSSRTVRQAGLLCMALVTFASASANAGEKPNIVMVLIDDMGWGDFSCFGNTLAKTPNFDRLAAEGIRFSQFYVNSPICSPSRTALTTGQYPQRWRITSFLNNRAENEKRGMAQWLDLKAPTVARMLKQNGYATGHFGKWHMGGQRDVGEAPLITEYGFDESLTNFEGLGARLLPLCDAHDGKELRPHALGSDKLGRGPIIWQDRSQISAGYIGAAIGFIKKAAAENQPFFVNVWPDDVHSPFFPPESKLGDRSKRTLYHGVLETLDAQIGQLFDLIRNDPKLRDNTLVLVCSDNGPEPGAGSAGPFRGAKGTLYEGGVRSPLIAWSPSLIPADKAGSHNETSVLSEIDLMASILAVAGVKVPENVALDGENVSEALLGKSAESRKAPIFWRRPPDRKNSPQGPLRDLAVREGNWKLLCDYDGSDAELYDLAQDRAEGSNVAAQHPEIVQGLTAKLLAWNQSVPPDNGATYAAAGRRGQGRKKTANATPAEVSE